MCMEQKKPLQERGSQEDPAEAANSRVHPRNPIGTERGQRVTNRATCTRISMIHRDRSSLASVPMQRSVSQAGSKGQDPQFSKELSIPLRS